MIYSSKKCSRAENKKAQNKKYSISALQFVFKYRSKCTLSHSTLTGKEKTTFTDSVEIHNNDL